MPEIEPASREDGVFILGITAAVGIFIPVELDCVEELWDAYQDSGETSGYVFLVYRDDDGHVLGYACFGPHPLTEGTYDLYWVVVDPAAQGRGIGHALVAQVEAEVQNRGGYLLVIETSGTLPYGAARRLYQSSSYRCEATVRNFYGRGDDMLIFVKDLGEGQPRPGAAA
jgi:ribosomal protein S18 acetylase RimI-like enzyme